MITIEMTVTCDDCSRQEELPLGFLDGNATNGITVMRKMRSQGWKFLRDREWKLVLVLCPDCVKNKKRGNGVKRRESAAN